MISGSMSERVRGTSISGGPLWERSVERAGEGGGVVAVTAGVSARVLWCRRLRLHRAWRPRREGPTGGAGRLLRGQHVGQPE